MKPQKLSRDVVYESPWVNLYLDKVKFPNGVVIEQYHLLDFAHSAVTAIVENSDGEIVFVRVCRYTSGSCEWELPAGGVDSDESILDAAKREVLEETGYLSQEHELLYSYYPMNGSANKIFHVVYCKAGEHVQDFDENEISETRWFTKAEAKQMIRDRTLSDGFSLTALLVWLFE